MPTLLAQGLQRFADDRISTNDTFGDDDRLKVTQPQSWLFSPICRLILDFEAGTGSGSGILISEHIDLHSRAR